MAAGAAWGLAAFLLGLPGDAVRSGRVDAGEAVRRLSLEGRRSVVLTGYSRHPGHTGALCLDASDGTVTCVQNQTVQASFPGTGDLFASVLCGGLLRGASLADAAATAAGFVHDCVERTAAKGLPPSQGVEFEPLLGKLLG